MSKEVSDKHQAAAEELLLDICDENATYDEDVAIIAAALAKVERDTFKRAAEIARGNSGEYDFQAALAEGRDFDYGFHNGKNHAGDSILAEIILSEAGEA